MGVAPSTATFYFGMLYNSIYTQFALSVILVQGPFKSYPMPRKNNSQSHQHFQPTPDCSHKRSYVSELKAQDAAEYQMLVKPRLELSVYKCDLCRNWHLTRRQPLV